MGTGMRNSLINVITEHAEKDKKLFFISGDAGYGVLDEFKERFPDRYLNMGVAEQNMISFAAGLGLAGYKVFVYNIIPFVLYRCYEQVRNDVCYQRLPITLIGIGSGVTYAPQGVTHYAVEDIAIARTLPNLVILSPADPVESEKCAEFALESKLPVYIRVAKSGETIIHEHGAAGITKPLLVSEGEQVAVLFHGSIGSEVIKAVEGMKRHPIVISIPMLQPLDFRSLLERLEGIRSLITVEEHFREGGLGTIISEWIAKEKLSFDLKKLGIKNEFIHSIKKTSGMREFYGISCKRIRRAISEVLEGG